MKLFIPTPPSAPQKPARQANYHRAHNLSPRTLLGQFNEAKVNQPTAVSDVGELVQPFQQLKTGG